jgi:uncharacterized protein YjbJ (UPF0337 family)
MNWTQVEGKWGQLKGQVRSKWSKLTDDDIGVLDGKRETLVGKLTERYGIMKDEAEKQVDGWLGSLDADRPPPRN